MIVADTNLVSYLLIEGEQTEGARAVWSMDPDWRLPPLWRAEFLNVLATSARAGVLDREQALLVWGRATALFGGGEVEPEGEAVLEVALRWGLSAYDAQFVCVAERLGVPLVTADKAILRACRDRAHPITSFGRP
ncbi:type II toxin-antitoxin system VapC family toxin [Myxococcota bacterium]|nr:type II toxin-antitoxin system VapC family toxin [Myxococcota bacterium]